MPLTWCHRDLLTRSRCNLGAISVSSTGLRGAHAASVRRAARYRRCAPSADVVTRVSPPRRDDDDADADVPSSPSVQPQAPSRSADLNPRTKFDWFDSQWVPTDAVFLLAFLQIRLRPRNLPTGMLGPCQPLSAASGSSQHTGPLAGVTTLRMPVDHRASGQCQWHTGYTPPASAPPTPAASSGVSLSPLWSYPPGGP